MSRRALAAALVLAGLSVASPARAALSLEPVGTFASPVYVTAPPGAADRLMVVERAGRVQELVGGVARPAPFLDISGRVSCCAGERGMGSIAFPRDYAQTGTFYAYYTARNPVGAITISRFQRSASDPDIADPASEQILVQIPHDLQSNHDGGQVQVGPDGKLYAGTGDGGSGGDPAGNGQNTTPGPPGSAGGVNKDYRLGKLLRIDPSTGALEIYASGLRNPWRFSFDRATGDLLIGDVGQDSYEEVDALAAGTGAGTNFGWNRYEGLHTYPGGAPASSAPGFTFPVIERSHSADGVCSITGGYVVRDPGLPSLAGRYVYGDFCDADIRSAAVTPSGASGDGPTGLRVSSLSSFGEDACGRVYVASLDGPVSRISEGPSTCTLDAAGTPVATPIAAPAKPLSLRLRVTHRQHALRTRRLSLQAGCDVRCTVSLSARVRGHRLKAVRATAAARRYRTLRERLGPTVRRSARRALARGSRVTATLTVRARDASGRTRVRTTRVRVVL